VLQATTIDAILAKSDLELGSRISPIARRFCRGTRHGDRNRRQCGADLIWRYLAAPRRFRSSKPYPLFLRRLLLGPIYVGGGRGSARSGSAADPAQAPRPRELVPREASWSNTGPPGRWRCER